MASAYPTAGIFRPRPCPALFLIASTAPSTTRNRTDPDQRSRRRSSAPAHPAPSPQSSVHPQFAASAQKGSTYLRAAGRVPAAVHISSTDAGIAAT